MKRKRISHAVETTLDDLSGTRPQGKRNRTLVDTPEKMKKARGRR
jgi:GTPase Era involved in 16S rRNA processing